MNDDIGAYRPIVLPSWRLILRLLEARRQIDKLVRETGGK